MARKKTVAEKAKTIYKNTASDTAKGYVRRSQQDTAQSKSYTNTRSQSAKSTAAEGARKIYEDVWNDRQRERENERQKALRDYAQRRMSPEEQHYREQLARERGTYNQYRRELGNTDSWRANNGSQIARDTNAGRARARQAYQAGGSTQRQSASGTTHGGTSGYITSGSDAFLKFDDQLKQHNQKVQQIEDELARVNRQMQSLSPDSAEYGLAFAQQKTLEQRRDEAKADRAQFIGANRWQGNEQTDEQKRRQYDVNEAQIARLQESLKNTAYSTAGQRSASDYQNVRDIQKRIDQLTTDNNTLRNELTYADLSDDWKKRYRDYVALEEEYTRAAERNEDVNPVVGRQQAERAVAMENLKREIQQGAGLDDDQFRYALDSAKRAYTAEQTAAMQEQVAQMGTGQLALNNALTVFNNFAKIKDISPVVDALINDVRVDTNALRATNFNDIVRGETSERILKSKIAPGVLNFLYQTGMSIADFSVMIPLDSMTGGSALSLALMGTSAGISSVKEATERGMNARDALVTGIMAGTFEAVFEKVSIETLLNPDGAKNALSYILKNALAEGSEEVCTTLANTLADRLRNGGQSEYNQSILAYIQQGYSEEEARRLAGQDFAKQLAMDFAGGALSGMVMAGVMSATPGMKANFLENQINDLKAQNAQTIQNMIEGREPFDLAKLTNNWSQQEQLVRQQSEILDPNAPTIGLGAREGQRFYNEDNAQPSAANASNALKTLSSSFDDSAAVEANETGTQTAEAVAPEERTQFNSLEEAQETLDAIGDQIDSMSANDPAFTELNTRYQEVSDIVENWSENEVSLRNSSQWNDSQSAGGQVSSVESQAGRNAAVRQYDSRSADQGLDKVSYSEPVSAVDLGFENGTAEKNLYRITGNYTQAQQDTIKMFTDRGYAEDDIVLYTGNDITFSYTSADGSTITDRVRGAIDPVAHKVWVRADARDYTALQIGTHELTHQRIADGEISVASELGKIMGRMGTAQLNKLIDSYASAFAGIGMTEAEAIEEIVCDAHANMNVFARRNNSEAARMSMASEAVREASTETEARGPPAETQAILNKVEKGKALSSDEEVKASRALNDKLQEDAYKKNKELGFVDKDVMDIADKQRRQVKAWLERPGIVENLPEDYSGKTVLNNGSYGKTYEPTTICPRTLATEGLLDAVSKKVGHPLTVQESIWVAQSAWEYLDNSGECTYCYVAMDRKAKREFRGRYIQQREQVLQWLKDGTKVSEAQQRYAKEILGRTKGNKATNARVSRWAKIQREGGDFITNAMLATEETMQEAVANNPALADEMNDVARYSQSASYAKKYIGFTAYNGEILNMQQPAVDLLNSNFGLRMYSFSDYHPAFLLENMQVITDAAVRGLKVLAYTKDIDFATAFEPTHANINISVFAQQNADADGNFHEDAMQGAEWEKAKAVRERSIKNGTGVGIVMVATSDQQVEWALAQDWIDVVIPFHMVKTGAEVAETFGWKNYTRFQEDHKTKGWKKDVNVKSIAPPMHQNNLQMYKAALEANNLTARFEQWIDNPNYMKLVNETRRAEGQTPTVQPVFNMDGAKESVDSIAKGREYFRPVGGSQENLDVIAEDVAKELQSGKSGRKFSRTVDIGAEREQRIYDIEKRLSQLSDEALFATDLQERRIQNEMVKLRHELDTLHAEERKEAVKTPLQTILDNLDNYRRLDLISMGNQLTNDAWDELESLDVDEIKQGIREIIEEREYSPLEMQAKSRGLYVRPAETASEPFEKGTSRQAERPSMKIAVDSEGNQLSVGQERYFAESKVRDRDGNLLLVHHGSPATDITTFDKSRGGSHTGTYSDKDMLWFTDSQEFADDMSYEQKPGSSNLTYTRGKRGKVYSGYLNIERPLDLNNLTDADRSLLIDTYVYRNGGTEQAAEERLDKLLDIGNHQLIKFDYVDYYALLASGYDGIIARLDVKSRGDGIEYGVFHSEQFKDANNTNPTSNPDIRYSRSVNSEGESLSKEQEEYFKDSKIRDEDGNLQVVYHGTDAEFTVFDRTKGRSTMDIQGSFFSPWDIDAAGYGPLVNAYYLNITNPAPEGVAYKALNRFKGQNDAGIKAREYLESLGYDGVNNGNEEYIAFNPEQIKLAGNLSPTSNPDIRYSRDTNDNTVEQKISSAKTSIKQIPALFKDKNVSFEETNIDIGGGRFDLATNYLAERGTQNMVFDPYNRDEATNQRVIDFLRSGNKADTATCANVLNVIAEAPARANVILEVAKSIKDDGRAYFMVYEGDGSGEGRETSSGYQNNRKTATYVSEIEQFFDDVTRKGKLIIAENPKSNLPKASWEVQPGKAVQFSRTIESDDIETLRQANKDLRKTVDTIRKQKDYWKAQTKTSVPTVTQTSANKMAAAWIERTGSTLKKSEVAAKIKALGDWLRSGSEDITILEARTRARAIARDLIDSAEVLANDMEMDAFDDIKKSLKQAMMISPTDASNIPDFEDWRKSHFGQINIRKGTGGFMVDQAYMELSQAHPEYFPEDIAHPADQLLRMADVYDSMEPIYVNPYDSNYDEALGFAEAGILEDAIGMEQTAPTYADRKEAEIDLLKRKAADKLQSVRQQRDQQIQALKDHYKEVAEKKRARRADSEARTRLLKIAKRLRNKKLPAVTRAKIDEYIGDLDLVAKSMTGATEMKLSSLKEWYEDQKKNNPDFIANATIEAKLDRLNKRQINDLTQEEVADLTDILLNIENEIRTQDKFIKSEIAANTYAAGQQVIADIEATRGPSKADKLVTGMLTPEREARRITGYRDSDPLYVAVRELSKGANAMYAYQNDAERQVSKWTHDEKFMKTFAGPKAKEISLAIIGRPDIVITPAMRASLYLHSLNADNMKHIANGGATIPDMKLYKRGKIQEAYDKGITIKLTPSQVKAITSEMSSQERAYAQATSQYFNTTSRDAINAVSEAKDGFSIAGVENYFPIDTNKAFLKSDFETIKRDGTIEGMGFTKERVNASNPLMLYDMDTVLNRSISQHAKYVGLAIPVRNFNKLWNVGTWIDETEPSGVQNSLIKVWGRDSYDYVAKMMADLQNPKSQSDDIGKLLGNVRSKYAGAVLELNLSVAIKQSASYPTAAAVLGYGPLIKAMGNFGKVNLDIVRKYSPMQAYREKGFSTQELGEITSRKGKTPTLLNWIQGMDVETTRKLWKASEYYVRDNFPNLKRGTEEYYRKVGEIHTKVLEETQPNYTVMQRPQFLRSDSDLTKTLMMFKTQPFQNFNILYDATENLKTKYRAFKNGGSEADFKAARKGFARAVSSQMLASFVFALMQYAWDGFRKKDDKYRNEDEELTLGSWLKGMSINMLSNGFGMLPFGSEIFEQVEAGIDKVLKRFGADAFFDARVYGLSDSIVDQINDTVSAVTKVTDELLKMGSEDWDGAVAIDTFKDSAATIAQFAGIPVKNVLNLYKAARDNVDAIIQGNDPESYQSKKSSVLKAAHSATGWDKLDEKQQTKLEGEINKWAMDTGSNEEAKYVVKNQTPPEGLRDTEAGKIIEGGKGAGLSAEEYFSFRIALFLADRPTESGKTGTFNQGEIAYALQKASLSDKERRYIWSYYYDKTDYDEYIASDKYKNWLKAN